jgi:xylosylprotein 4-beta-galactosyltransferase
MRYPNQGLPVDRQERPVQTAQHNTRHTLCILVPFRDRFTQLTVFVPHLHKFLQNQGISHKFFIINQIDNYRFNRASLLNVGFLESPSICSYFALHDVDLLPLNAQLPYGYPEDGPFHVASPDFHPKYDYETFTGGILLIRSEHFSKVNGLSNRYWGWGLEDDEFRARVLEANLEIKRPVGIKSHRNDTFRHIHTGHRDYSLCYNQYEVTRKRDRQTGLNTTKYDIYSRPQLTIESIPVNVLNVLLKCDKKETPWCECDKGARQHTFKKANPKEDRTDVIVPIIKKQKQRSNKDI